MAYAPLARDGWVPWPWGHEQPITWDRLQGTWKVDVDSGMLSQFSFKVVRSRDRSIRVLVKQIDVVHCRVIASGIGFETNNVLRAQMTTEDGGAYRLSLRAFRAEDSPKPVIGKETNVMVLSMTDLGNLDPAGTRHIQIGKTSAQVDLKSCTEKKGVE